MTDGQPLISVIVPVYNVENYIRECVDSILKVEMNLIEILLIDDGSTDSSGSICDWYADRYDRVMVFHQENQGLSAARNKGIKESRGRFLLFVDSDDYIKADALLEILKIIRRNPCVDIFFLSGKKIYPDGRWKLLDEKFKKERIENCNRNEVFQYLSELKKYPGSACTKLINKRLVIQHELWFEEGKTCEDLLWCLRVFLNAEKFGVIDRDYYYYRQQRENSITQHYDENKLICILDVIKDGCILAKNKNNKMIKSAVYSFMAYEYVIALLVYCYGKKDIPKEVRSRYINCFKNYRFLLLYRKDIRMKIIWHLTQFLSIEIIAGLVGVYDRIK